MRYILPLLLGSVNVLASSLFYVPSQEAEQQNLKGYTVTHASNASVAFGTSNTKNQTVKPLNEFQKSRINLRSLIEVKDDEHEHKVVLDLRLGTDQLADQSSLIYLHQGYIELQNAKTQPLRAKISFGLQNTAANSLAVNSSTTMKNMQGLAGNWYRFVQMPIINQSGGYNSTFILQNTSLISQGFGDATFLHSQRNGSLNYVQPNPNWSATNVGLGFTLQRIAGFKAAFTYQPFGNSGNFNGFQGNQGWDRRGIRVENAGREMFMKNITSLALNYLNEWRGISLNTTVSAEMAGMDTKYTAVIERERITQYTAGMNVSYIGFTLGGSYAYSGNSLLLKQNPGQINSFAVNNQSQIANLTQLQAAANSGLLNYKSSYNYDLGLSYAFGRYQLGVARNKSRFMNNNMNATVVSLSEDLKSVAGVRLTTIFEAGSYSFNSAKHFNENAGIVSVANARKNSGYFGYFSLVAEI